MFMAFYFLIIRSLIPLLYYSILISNASLMVTLKYISGSTRTIRNQTSNWQIRYRTGIAMAYILGIFVPLIPIPRFSIRCTEEVLYPYCFFYLLTLLIFAHWFARKLIRLIDIAEIKDPELAKFYKQASDS